MKKVFLALSALLVIGGITGCGSSKNSNSNSIVEDNYPETGEITNSLKLSRSIEGKNFLLDGIGQVTLGSLTDGDTAKFITKNKQGVNERFALRFLGVNTPESTAKVEPWGKAASVYVGKILNQPGISIVLENDIAVWGQKDNNGTRYLGFVWYKTSTMTDYRCLNLELIEMGFSRNQLFDDSSLCPYRATFERAGASAASKKLRINGQKDPAYDYDNQIKEVTISECRKNFETYGISDTFSGYQLRVEALVVGMIGDNMVLRDLQEDEETGMYAGIYAYLGYNTALASAVTPGDVVRFYCRLTKFNNNMQFTDVKSSFIGKLPFEILADNLTGPTEEYPSISMDPYVIDPASINRSADMASYAGAFIQTEIEIRNANVKDVDDDGQEVTTKTYYRTDANNNMTVYAKLNSGTFVPCNLRVDGLSSPRVSYTNFEVGKKYRVMGLLASYYENYQIQLFNNIPSANYIVAL